MKLFKNLLGTAQNVYDKYEAKMKRRVEELTKQDKSKEDIIEIITQESEKGAGFAEGMTEEFGRSLKLTGDPKTENQIVMETRRRLLRIKAGTYANLIPRVHYVKDLPKHIDKIEEVSQKEILLYLEIDKISSKKEDLCSHYDGMFEGYSAQLERAKKYKEALGVCKEYLDNPIYRRNTVRTGFSDRIRKRITNILNNKGINLNFDHIHFPGWLEDAERAVAEDCKKANAVTYQLIKEVEDWDQYVWLLSSDSSREHCKDCVTFAGLGAKSYSEWYKLGLPGVARTKCKNNCSCTLTKTKTLPTI
jgi:hypothetical protein